MPCKMVAYYRVSTQRQAASGLGIEGQRADVERHAAAAGCDIIADYTETETGKKHSLDNRPQLRSAIAHARRSKAVLVVAKLDRLLRSTVVCSLLKTSGVRFVACDNPHANELTVDILCAVAEDEVRRISARTKTALAAYKARGGVLGAARPECNTLTMDARLRGATAAGKAHTAKAVAAYDDLVPEIKSLRSQGLSLRAIAQRLNEAGQNTRSGKPWNGMQVSRVIEIASKAQPS